MYVQVCMCEWVRVCVSAVFCKPLTVSVFSCLSNVFRLSSENDRFPEQLQKVIRLGGRRPYRKWSWWNTTRHWCRMQTLISKPLFFKKFFKEIYSVWMILARTLPVCTTRERKRRLVLLLNSLGVLSIKKGSSVTSDIAYVMTIPTLTGCHFTSLSTICNRFSGVICSLHNLF